MMNKQEVIEKIEACKSPFISEDDTIFNYGLDKALSIIKQLDEPEKPVVPQFVADWYEEHIGGDFEYNLYCLYIDYYEQKLDGDFKKWIGNGSKNKSIQTLVAMHQLGYEVEKEKLYRMKHNLTNEYLCFTTKRYFHSNEIKLFPPVQRTEKEWEESGYWNNNLYVPEEVKE